MISPCVRICVMNRETGNCEGCGRTIDEIAGWSTFSDAERQRIMDVLPERMAANEAAEFNAPRPGPASPVGWRSR